MSRSLSCGVALASLLASLVIAWSSASPANAADCYSPTTWNRLPQQAIALKVYRPTFTAGLRPGALTLESSQGRHGFSILYGDLPREGIALEAGGLCASGEWGDFDQPPVSTSTIRLLGYRAQMTTKASGKGALIVWEVGRGLFYSVASHEADPDVVLRFARGLRYQSPRYCVVDVTPLNIRVAPGTGSRRIGAIPVGDCTVRNASAHLQLKPAPNGRSWRWVSWRGIRGWVSDAMLRAAR